MLGQVAGITVDDVTLAPVVAALGSSHQPIEIDRARLDRQIREQALEHAAGGLGDDTYLARLKALREAREATTARTATGVPGQRAVEWLRTREESLKEAEVPEETANLLHAIYERTVVAGPEIVRVRLTSAAYAHGLALALPEKVAMAPDRCRVGTQQPKRCPSRAAVSGSPPSGDGHEGRVPARCAATDADRSAG